MVSTQFVFNHIQGLDFVFPYCVQFDLTYLVFSFVLLTPVGLLTDVRNDALLSLMPLHHRRLKSKIGHRRGWQNTMQLPPTQSAASAPRSS